MTGSNGWQNRIVAHGSKPASQFQAHPSNYRTHPQPQRDAVAASLRELGWVGVVIENVRTGNLVDGHERVWQALKAEDAEVPYIQVDLSEDEESLALAVLDPITNMASVDAAKLDDLLKDVSTGEEALQALLAEMAEDAGLFMPNADAGADEPEATRAKLAERFVVPPFSVLDARQGYWQERKRAWLTLGIQSETGRSNTTGNNSFREYANRDRTKQNSEAYTQITALAPDSIFDPVLCEIAFRWFCPPDGKVLDPFAGGSVRGIVAAWLGRQYIGVELRPEQVEANRVQAETIEASPQWVVGNSKDVQVLAPGAYDFLFSCPPYYDLEVYSDMPGELSALGTYDEFMAEYRTIVASCVGLLADDRFACFVVGDIRDKRGMYCNFVSDTIAAFRDAGMELYNEAILVTALGSLPIRVGKQFTAGRKLGKTHQNVLVFVKGDPRKATETVGEIDVPTTEELADLGLTSRLAEG